MKVFSVALVFGLALFSPTSFSSEGEISGTVSLAKAAAGNPAPTGILYIFARTYSKTPAAGGPPAAVLRIPSPKFPVSFKLTSQNMMMPGTKFQGPFSIHARLSPSGDASDKSGLSGQTQASQAIEVGAKDLKIELAK